MTSHTPATHDEIVQLIPEYVLGDLSAEQLSAVESHLDTCGDCVLEVQSASVIHRLAASDSAPPPTNLRSQVLDAAFAARAPQPRADQSQIAAWEAEIGRFLSLLSEPDLEGRWDDMCVARFGLTIRAMACHLIAAESLWAEQLGADFDDAPESESSLEARTRAVVDRHSSLPVTDSHRELGRLTNSIGRHLRALAPKERAADSGVLSGFSIDDYVAFRALETWTHADDIRAAVGHREVAPEAPHIATMTSVLPSWISMVMKRAGHPTDQHVRIELTGPGGQMLDVFPSAGDPQVTMRCDAVEFCKLLAARRDAGQFDYQAKGDQATAQTLVHTVAAFELI